MCFFKSFENKICTTVYCFPCHAVYHYMHVANISLCRHEVADVAGLTSFSFGQEEIDRYVMLWKKVHYCSIFEI